MILDKSFPKETDRVKKENLPLVFAAGTVEYHGPHCSYGCDTLVAEGLIRELSKRKEIMIAPTISYSPASYAVGDDKSGTVHIPERAFEEYVYYVFRSMLNAGFRNIYVVIHHQFEQECEKPMTLCYRLAASRAIMDHLEKTMGQGWWGSENYSDYYSQLGGDDNPFNWIKVIPTMTTEVQNATGYDHAGEFECSILMALYPEAVDLSRLEDKKHWFTESAKNANKELGEKMVALSLASLEERIK